MPRYRILDQQGLNYVTCTVVGWVDVFTRKTYRDILIESLAYCRKEKGLMVCAYVIMSNHIHMIVLVSPKVIWQKVDYIHQNPVRAGWVEKEEEYLYSSARNYVLENQGCLLEVDLLEPYLPGSSFVYLPGYDDQS